MRKNISLLSLEFVDSPFPLSGNKDTVTGNLRSMVSTSSADVMVLSFLSPTSPWAKAIQEISLFLPSEKTIQCAHILAVVNHMEHTGRIALAVDQLDLSGTAIYLSKDGFYLTSFGYHQLETQYFHWEDLALSYTPSPYEIQILSLGWVLYSVGKAGSMLEAIDDARKEIRK